MGLYSAHYGKGKIVEKVHCQKVVEWAALIPGVLPWDIILVNRPDCKQNEFPKLLSDCKVHGK